MRWPLKVNRLLEPNGPYESSSTTEDSSSDIGPERLAVDSVFRSDAALRTAITENLKPLRGESEAISARVETGFADFDLGPVLPQDGTDRSAKKSSADGVREFFKRDGARQAGQKNGAARNYVAPGADISETLDNIVMEGVETFKSLDNRRGITFSNSALLDDLRTERPDGSSSVELRKVIELIDEKSSGSLIATPTYTQCKAAKRADEIVAEIEAAHKAEAAAEDDTATLTRDADELVEESVNRQMNSATSPEERLAYGSMPKIPNTADQDESQKAILTTFELRPGPSDVPSYHDFHTLQIAFQHVWTRIFNGELETLGRELYREYVKLKNFGGFTTDDLKVNTVKDLHRLIEEVRTLSQWVADDIPSDLGGSKDNGQRGSNGAGDLQTTIDVATGGLTWLLRQALEEFSKIGRKPIITWEQFPGPWSPRTDKIDKSVLGGIAPKGNVEIALRTDDGSHVKILELELFDQPSQRYVHGQRLDNRYGPYVSMVVPTAWMTTSVLEFASEETSQWDTPGRYVLAELGRVIVDQSRVTFHWKDS